MNVLGNHDKCAINKITTLRNFQYPNCCVLDRNQLGQYNITHYLSSLLRYLPLRVVLMLKCMDPLILIRAPVQKHSISFSFHREHLLELLYIPLDVQIHLQYYPYFFLN